MGVLAANAAVAAGILLAGIAFLLFVVGAIAYRRVRHARLLWVALAFLALCAQGVLLALEAYARRADVAAGSPVEALLFPALGLAAALCLYLAVLKR
ncbi:MAG TPA: hypothetical protein VM286_02285 [Candidatus Thermoplasmatota archaeon]|nr:hypothetical protein [Candidatus Thermoplasmatota archaeon]